MNHRNPVVPEAARNDTDGGNGMNIRRFVAENSRAALRQVRDTLGGDAIILANRSVEGGVEVLAAAPEAVDALTRRMTATTPASLPLASAQRASPQVTPTDLGLKPASGEAAAASSSTAGKKRLASLFGRRTEKHSEAPLPSMAEQTSVLSTPRPMTPARSAATSYLSFADELTAAAVAHDADDEDFVTRIAPEAVTLSRPAAVAQPAPVVVVQPAIVEPVAPAEPVINVADLNDVVAREVHKEVSREIGRELGRDVINDLTHDVSQAVAGDVTRDVTREVAKEIHAMQAALTEQLSTLTWTDAMRRQPARTKLMQDLILAGFSPALSRHIQERVPEGHSIEEAREWATSVLARNLPVASDGDELIAEGGVYALVGPTGVGKTTTVAKLAARFALKHGVDQLALITTDGFRIGAQDQLRIYGKILGVPVHSIHDQASLTSTIEQLANKKLVLIDTAGLSQRDERVTEQIAMLRGAKAKRLVVLNATVDAETLDHVVAAFGDRAFAGCVITKTDEAARLGPVLDAVIRHRLRVHHVSTGQRVPEDLERPHAATLVRTAMARIAVARPAFDIETEDAPVWMSAMAGLARTLPPTLIETSSAGAHHA
jgi:flagellar biosynthesis protein FlhF